MQLRPAKRLMTPSIDFGAIDVVVNNAGYGSIAPIEDMTEDVFRAQVETNFFGTVNVTRAALPYFCRCRGHFIQISSIGRTPRNGRTQRLSIWRKFAVEGFSEGLAKETVSSGHQSNDHRTRRHAHGVVGRIHDYR